MKVYAVYILCNKKYGTLYIGFTNDIYRRMYEHRRAVVESFTKQYDLKRLVYLEPFKYVNDAIAREKQLKRFKRQWKINLIEQTNPQWLDLAEHLLGMTSDMDPGILLGQGPEQSPG